MTSRACVVLVGAAALIVTCAACGSDPAPSARPVPMAEASSEPVETTARREQPRPRRASASASREQPNRPPVLRSIDVRDSDADPTQWVVEFSADDPDGDAVEVDVVWFVNREPVARGELEFDPTAHGRGDRIHVEATPHDGQVAGATGASRVIELSNAAPAITSTPPAKMVAGVYRYMVVAEDAEGDAPLRYTLAQSPPGMRIDPFNGELEWRPTADQAGEHTVVIEVADSAGASSTQEFVLPIVGPPGSAPAAPAP